MGEAQPILVNATQAGTIGWIIAIVAGVVLVGATAFRIRQVAKERSAESDAKTGAADRICRRNRRRAGTVGGVATAGRTTESPPPPPPPPAKDRDPLDV